MLQTIQLMAAPPSAPTQSPHENNPKPPHQLNVQEIQQSGAPSSIPGSMAMFQRGLYRPHAEQAVASRLKRLVKDPPTPTVVVVDAGFEKPEQLGRLVKQMTDAITPQPGEQSPAVQLHFNHEALTLTKQTERLQVALNNGLSDAQVYFYLPNAQTKKLEVAAQATMQAGRLAFNEGAQPEVIKAVEKMGLLQPAPPATPKPL